MLVIACGFESHRPHHKEKNMSFHEKWFISDTHFFHTNILEFLKKDGTRLRPFNSIDEMHELIVNSWNSVISENDFVYHLGDVTFQYHRPFQELMYSLKGNKRLIVGNHDKLLNMGLLKHFNKVMLWHGFKEHNFTASHLPLKEGHFRDGVFNLHGHTHANDLEDKKYINCCVEATQYKPKHIEEIREIIKNRSM